MFLSTETVKSRPRRSRPRSGKSETSRSSATSRFPLTNRKTRQKARNQPRELLIQTLRRSLSLGSSSCRGAHGRQLKALSSLPPGPYPRSRPCASIRSRLCLRRCRVCCLSDNQRTLAQICSRQILSLAFIRFNSLRNGQLLRLCPFLVLTWRRDSMHTSNRGPTMQMLRNFSGTRPSSN